MTTQTHQQIITTHHNNVPLTEFMAWQEQYVQHIEDNGLASPTQILDILDHIMILINR